MAETEPKAVVQKRALMDLYRSTYGDGWKQNHNWNSNAHLCAWGGVEVDKLGDVVALILADNRLRGSVLESICRLTNLQWLVLPDNQLMGSMLQNLAKLPNLRLLNLSHNQLTDSIPESIALHANLQELNLSNNLLTGPIPSSVCQLTNLQRLHLSNNQLTGPIPANIGRLTNLRWLNLSNNQLTGPIAELLHQNEYNVQQARKNRKWKRCVLEQQILCELAPLHRIRVHVCGHPLAGKSQMIKTWQKKGVLRMLQYTTGAITPIDPSDRTIGIEVQNVVLRHKEFSVWDYGGQLEFQMLHHHHLARDEGAAFVLVASIVTVAQGNERAIVVREPSLVARELSYWLSFLQSVRSGSQREALELCVVLTHRDCCGRRFDKKSYINRVRKELGRLVRDWTATTKIWCINSLNPTDCISIFDGLCERHAAITQKAARIPRLCKQLEEPLNELRHATAAKRCTLRDLLAAARQHVAEFTSTEQLMAAIEWLDVTGEVIWCKHRLTNDAERDEAKNDDDAPYQAEGSNLDDVIFLDPTWLCQKLVGRMTASAEMLRRGEMEVVWEDGLHNPTMQQVMDFARVLELDVSEEDMCHVFEHFKLGVRYFDNRGEVRLMVPMRLTNNHISVVDLNTLNNCKRTLGRQLRARPPNVFVPGFFPQLQLRAFQLHGALLWRSGLLLKHTSDDGMEAHAIIEAAELASLGASAGATEVAMAHITALNVYVWGHADGGDTMMELLGRCEGLMMDVLLEMVGVGEVELRRHRLDVFALGPGCVREWTSGHHTPCTYKLYREPYNGEFVHCVSAVAQCGVGLDSLHMLSMEMLIDGNGDASSAHQDETKAQLEDIAGKVCQIAQQGRQQLKQGKQQSAALGSIAEKLDQLREEQIISVDASPQFPDAPVKDL